VKKKLAPKACAVLKSPPRFIAFEMPSAPTAKYPRIALFTFARRFHQAEMV
jgi:hypothetical protein